MAIKSVDNDSSSIFHYSVCVTDDFRRTRIIRRDTILKMMKHLRKVIILILLHASSHTSS